MIAKRRVLIAALALLAATLLVLFCGRNDSIEMTPYEFLSHILPPEDIFTSEDGKLWYRSSDNDENPRLLLMAPLEERKKYSGLSMRVLSCSGDELHISAKNRDSRTLKTLKSNTYISVKLSDGWYPIPALGAVYAGHVEPGEKGSVYAELRQRTGSVYTLPSGKYRFEYYIFDSEIGEFRSSIAEFELICKNGEYRIK